jgi:hypothetical protein
VKTNKSVIELTDLDLRLEKLIKLLSGFNDRLGKDSLTRKLTHLNLLTTTINKEQLASFYNNNLTDKSLQEIENCINHINKNKSKLAILGISQEWEMTIINRYIDNKIVFKLATISMQDGIFPSFGSVDYDSFRLICYSDLTCTTYIDRLIVNFDNLFGLELLYDSKIRFNDLVKLLKFTPETYIYTAINDTNLISADSLEPLVRYTDFIRFLNTNIKSLFISVLNECYTRELSTNPDLDELTLNNNEKAKFNKVKDLAIYTLNNIVDSFLVMLKAFNEKIVPNKGELTIQAVEVSEQIVVMSDIVSIMTNQSMLDEVTKCIVGYCKDQNTYLIGNRATFIKYMEMQLGFIESSIDTKTGDFGYMVLVTFFNRYTIQPELIKFLNLLRTGSLLESLSIESCDGDLLKNKFRTNLVINPQAESLIDKINNLVRQYTMNTLHT